MITSAGGMAGGTEDSGITSAIKKILSENGQIIEDPRTNSLVVTDIPSRMPIITKTIAALDIPQLQVMLEVEMLDVSKNAVDKIGLKFGNSSSPSIMTMVLTGAKRTTMFPFSAWTGGDFDKSGRAGNAGNITAGNIDFSTPTYTVLLDFFKSLSDTKYLARPRILTLNNETAEIKITTQETVGVTSSVSSGAGGITTGTGNTADRVETGVSLRVTPQINPDTAEITMFIMPSVKDTSTSSFINSGTTYFKDPEERSTRTTVRIKDGETVIIGGLIRNDSSETTTKLPFLGDIPVLGALFRHKNKEKDRERELLVFITPHIIKESPIELAKTNNLPEKNLLLEREQQPSESLIERKQSINTSLSKFER